MPLAAMLGHSLTIATAPSPLRHALHKLGAIATIPAVSRTRATLIALAGVATAQRMYKARSASLE